MGWKQETGSPWYQQLAHLKEEKNTNNKQPLEYLHVWLEEWTQICEFYILKK